MYKVISLLLVVLMLSLSLCACGNQPADTTQMTTTPTTIMTAEPTNDTTGGRTAATTPTDVTTEEAATDAVTSTTVVSDPTVSTTRTTKTTKTTKTAKTAKTTKTNATNPSTYGVTLYGPEDGLVIDPLRPAVREYLALDTEKEAAEFWVSHYTGNDVGASFTVSWKPQSRSLYEVTWADNAAFTNAKAIKTVETELTITGLMNSTTYYWKVKNTSSGQVSEVRTVEVLDGQVRIISADGARNMRDIGGWKAASGKTVRYGMLYRGACIDGYNGIALTTLGRQQFCDMLGIKTQIDLRGGDDGDSGTQSSSDFGGKYVKAPVDQYEYVFRGNSGRESLRKIFAVLADESNYPIYFHCNWGADRTGTLAFIINGLLGVSYEDLTRDFELTSMAIGKRLRSKLDVKTKTFDTSGVMDPANYIAWGPLYNKMMTNFGTGDGKLSSAIENFLTSQCGVTQTQINEVRRLMLQ